MGVGVPVAPTRAFVDADGYRTNVRTLEFVEVETRPLRRRSPGSRTSRRSRTPVEAEAGGAPAPTASNDDQAAETPRPIGQPEPGWSLWSDLES
ncbi:MAG: hypothetical protein QOI37_542 [Chloroflexota bacterium]|jgi:hypothetical protein|nr:hypothetical protein [Chloroflexota bacterium]